MVELKVLALSGSHSSWVTRVNPNVSMAMAQAKPMVIDSSRTKRSQNLIGTRVVSQSIVTNARAGTQSSGSGLPDVCQLLVSENIR